MRAKRGLIAFACILLLGAGASFGAGAYISKPVRHAYARAEYEKRVGEFLQVNLRASPSL